MLPECPSWISSKGKYGFATKAVWILPVCNSDHLDPGDAAHTPYFVLQVGDCVQSEATCRV